MPKKQIKILSIDGGGIRGIIPAIVLAEIERRVGKSLAEVFDVIGGTSTGGILALGLTVKGADGKAKYQAEQGLEFYLQNGPKVFSRSIWHAIRSLNNIIGPKFGSENIDSVLKSFFGESRLKDTLSEVLVPAYDIQNREPYFFKNKKAQSEPDRDFFVWEAARACSAASTYFPPKKLTLASGKEMTLVDGGLFDNNPGMSTYVETLKIYPDAEEYVMASLGTGRVNTPYYYNQIKNWGALQWAIPMSGIMLDGQSEVTNYHLDKVFENAEKQQRYFRFQAELQKGKDAVDNVTKEHMQYLVNEGNSLVKKMSESLDKLCESLI